MNNEFIFSFLILSFLILSFFILNNNSKADDSKADDSKADDSKADDSNNVNLYNPIPVSDTEYILFYFEDRSKILVPLDDSSFNDNEYIVFKQLQGFNPDKMDYFKYTNDGIGEKLKYSQVSDKFKEIKLSFVSVPPGYQIIYILTDSKDYVDSPLYPAKSGSDNIYRLQTYSDALVGSFIFKKITNLI